MGRAQQLKPCDVSLGQAFEFLKAYGKEGGTQDSLQHAIESREVMRRIVAISQGTQESVEPKTVDSSIFSYDAIHLLGFGEATAEPLPEAAPDEIVIRYGGWSLTDLRDAREDMWKQDWYEQYSWSKEKLPAGIYILRVPLPDSNRKNCSEQEKQCLRKDEQTAPVVLVATALLVHKIQTGEDLLKSDWTRCKEQAADGGRVALGWYRGRLCVGYYWDDRRNDYLWLSSARHFLLSSFISTIPLGGGVLFSAFSDLIHPPSIQPISSMPPSAVSPSSRVSVSTIPYTYSYT